MLQSCRVTDLPARKLIVIGNPILWRTAAIVRKVGRSEQQLIDDLLETMEGKDAVGLAAPQVGVSKRVFVARWEGNDFVFINPVIETVGDETVAGWEGCLSIPRVSGLVHRPERIRIRGLDRRGSPIRMEADGWLARIFCHETDHLNGVLITERAEKLYWSVTVASEEGEQTRLIPTTRDEIIAAFRKTRRLPTSETIITVGETDRHSFR